MNNRTKPVIQKYKDNKPYKTLDERVDVLSELFPNKGKNQWKKEVKNIIDFYGYYYVKENIEFLFSKNTKKIDNKYKFKHLKIILDLERSWRGTALTDCFLVEQKIRVTLGNIWGKHYFQEDRKNKYTINNKNLEKSFLKSLKKDIKSHKENKSYKEYINTNKKISILAPWLIIENITFGKLIKWIENTKDKEIKAEVLKSIFSIKESEQLTSRQVNKLMKKLNDVRNLRNHLSHQGTLQATVFSKKLGDYIEIMNSDFKIRSKRKDRYKREEITNRNNDDVSKEVLSNFINACKMKKFM